MLTNEKRAGRAYRALIAYCQYAECGDDHNSDEALIDLLVDLMHKARISGQDFKEALRLAEIHYESETS